MQVAANASYRVLSCRPVESETKLSFTSLADVMEPVADDVLPELPEPSRSSSRSSISTAVADPKPARDTIAVV